MIKSIKDKPNSHLMEIDLTGPDGNVFYLMGVAKRLVNKIYGEDGDPEYKEYKENLAVLEELGMNDLKTPKSIGEYVTQQMMESDYDNALRVFDKYLGHFVILWK